MLPKQIEGTLPRENSETLNSYAEKVSGEMPKISVTFSELTPEYEAVTYGIRKDVTISKNQKNNILDLSKYLIKTKKNT